MQLRSFLLQSMILFACAKAYLGPSINSDGLSPLLKMRRADTRLSQPAVSSSASSIWIDMLLRKKDEFLARVLELEVQAQLDIAEMLVYHIRKHTNGGIMMAPDGSSVKLQAHQRDTVELCGPAVIAILDRLIKTGVNDGRLHLYLVEAMGYNIFSKGFLKAGLSAGRLLRMINTMVQDHPNLRGGIPHVIQGLMWLQAPAPMRSVKKAAKSFEAAQAIQANTRNLYFCGVGAVLQKDFVKAEGLFQQALQLSQGQAQRFDRPSLGNDIEAESASEFLLLQCAEGVKLAQAAQAPLP